MDKRFDEKFMNLALDEARCGVNEGHGGPFGAIIVLDGEVLVSAHNEVLVSKDPTAHAEVVAIRRASKLRDSFNLSDCIIYTTSEPCPMCLSAIHWAGIKKIRFGSSSVDVEKIGFDDHLIYEILKGNVSDNLDKSQVMRDDCLRLLDLWAKKDNKIKY